MLLTGANINAVEQGNLGVQVQQSGEECRNEKGPALHANANRSALRGGTLFYDFCHAWYRLPASTGTVLVVGLT